jgi:hypothetical protein
MSVRCMYRVSPLGPVCDEVLFFLFVEEEKVFRNLTRRPIVYGLRYVGCEEYETGTVVIELAHCLADVWAVNWRWADR